MHTFIKVWTQDFMEHTKVLTTKQLQKFINIELKN